MRNKKKDIDRKLVLSKETIVNLGRKEMNELNGGWAYTDCTHCSCYIICPHSVSCP